MGLEAVLLGYPLALHLAFSPYEVGNIHWGQEQLIRVTSTEFIRILEKGVMVVILETARNRNPQPQSPFFGQGASSRAPRGCLLGTPHSPPLVVGIKFLGNPFANGVNDN